MTKSMTEAYHEWLKANPDANGWQEGPPYWDAFAAGAAAEREAVLQIIANAVSPFDPHPDNAQFIHGVFALQEVIERRIRQRGEKRDGK